MSIKSNIRREKDNEAKVVLKNLRISPQKLNLVLGMIRKQKADVAVSKLQFSKKRVSKDVEKALKSVISDAENNHSLDIDKLEMCTKYSVADIINCSNFELSPA